MPDYFVSLVAASMALVGLVDLLLAPLIASLLVRGRTVGDTPVPPRLRGTLVLTFRLGGALLLLLAVVAFLLWGR